MGDKIIDSGCTPCEPASAEVWLQMLTRNAFYSTISAREAGSPKERFIIARIEINRNFNLTVLDKDGQPVNPNILKRGERLERIYAKVLEEDSAALLFR